DRGQYARRAAGTDAPRRPGGAGPAAAGGTVGAGTAARRAGAAPAGADRGRTGRTGAGGGRSEQFPGRRGHPLRPRYEPARLSTLLLHALPTPTAPDATKRSAGSRPI